MKRFLALKTFVYILAFLLLSQTIYAHRVFIVGGGIAALTAARTLIKNGITPKLFEASGRLGGRIFTCDDPKSGITVELGGTFINRDHREIIELAKELNLSLAELKMESSGHREYFFNGCRLDYEKLCHDSWQVLERIYQDQETIAAEKLRCPRGLTQKERELDQKTIKTYLTELGASSLFLDLANATQRNENGMDIEYLNSLCLLDLIHIDPQKKRFLMDGQLGDEGCQIEGGNIRLIEALKQTIPNANIFLRHRLKKISRNGERLQLKFDVNGHQKTLEADTVILALPMPILRKEVDLSQDGLIPEKLKEVIAHLPYANAYKMILVFSQPIWRKHHEGMLELMTKDFDLWESSYPNSNEHNFHLTVFFGGQKAHEAHNNSETVEEVLSTLEELYPSIRNYFLGISATIHWPSYPYSQGTYAGPLYTGQRAMLDLLAHPQAQNIHLAGEQWGASKELGFMNTAVKSGYRVAREIINHLNNTSTVRE